MAEKECAFKAGSYLTLSRVEALERGMTAVTTQYSQNIASWPTCPQT